MKKTSTTNILAKIFKKTPEKKVKKKTVAKVAKKTKTTKKISSKEKSYYYLNDTINWHTFYVFSHRKISLFN